VGDKTVFQENSVHVTYNTLKERDKITIRDVVDIADIYIYMYVHMYM
jgi:hypothetical protein